MTNAPAAMTYASIVSQETVCIVLTFAAHNSLEVKTGNDMNAYITASVMEKVLTVLRTKFGDNDCGRHAIIVCALYGLKSAGAAFQAGIHPVTWTLTFGSNLRLTLLTTHVTMLIYFVTLTTSFACIVTL